MIPIKFNVDTNDKTKRPYISLKDRFWKRVEKGTNSGCWFWKGAKDRRGYGHLGRGGKDTKNYMAHRVSYEIHIGIIPEGLIICHSCDNPNCVNPFHLFAGTNSDNQKDSFNKGRHNMKGESHPNSTLTTQDALSIRELHTNGVKSSQIAPAFNITHQTVNKVNSRTRWAHV